MKTYQSYICQSCSHQSPKWIGKCPICNSWNSFTEETVRENLSKSPRKHSVKALVPSKINLVKKSNPSIQTNISQFDQVLGQGIVPGSLILFSGEPGIGKSTLTLQVASNISQKHKVLLVSGEESVDQISSRAQRLKLKCENLELLNEFNLESIIETIKTQKPSLVILDSIQVISSPNIPSSSGSISQIRYCAEQFLELSKTKNIAIIIIGHVTKDGNLAGPKLLEHLVDTVIHLEGDRYQQFRILRSQKNRFGSTSEVGIFEMSENGLNEVTNPSEKFLEGRLNNAIGSAISVTMEGTRPFLIEVQALTSLSPFGYPKRTANGFDLNRLQILIAVLEKFGKINLQNQDVFINIVGGIKINEPSADLAVLMAIASSYYKKPLPKNTAIFGEIGLSGELRNIIHQEKREKEAKKMGFNEIISPCAFKEIKNLLSNFR